MIDEKINKTITELEISLKNIESSRKQADNTIKAYNGLESSVKTYVQSLSSVKEKLELLVNLIGTDYDTKVKDFDKDRKTIVDSCQKTINEVNKSIKDIENLFSSNIKSFISKFNILIACNIVTIILVFLLAVFYWFK